MSTNNETVREIAQENKRIIEALFEELTKSRARDGVDTSDGTWKGSPFQSSKRRASALEKTAESGEELTDAKLIVQNNENLQKLADELGLNVSTKRRSRSSGGTWSESPFGGR